jgi:hypothetical protein
VFSSLVVKFSKKKADTSDEIVEKRLRKGLASEMFIRKADELTRRWAELREHAPRDAEEPRLLTGDVRRAGDLLGSSYHADIVFTSPPYGGTYDYHAHHALRLAWLRLDDRAFARSELGARRTLRGPEALGKFEAEVGQILTGLRRVVKDDGLVVLVIGDAEIGGQRISPIDQLDALAPRVGLKLIAGASEEKPDFRGGPPREEHVLALAPIAIPERRPRHEGDRPRDAHGGRTDTRAREARPDTQSRHAGPDSRDARPDPRGREARPDTRSREARPDTRPRDPRADRPRPDTGRDRPRPAGPDSGRDRPRPDTGRDRPRPDSGRDRPRRR